ncbi:MAG: TolC family protein [Gammaproteobacteria bacterium]|nr:TolC family protein [Gammaproteobacteria bacterium]
MRAYSRCHVNDDLNKSVLSRSCILFSAMLLLAVMFYFNNAMALTLAEAEKMALANDPLMASHEANARAWSNDAIADNQLPDPKLRVGLNNVPLDSFELSKEPMTQLSLGWMQSFPKGDTLELKQVQSEWRARAELARAKDRRLQLKLNLRQDFLNLYYQVQAGQIIRSSSKLFAQLLEITEAHYASGRINQQDVLRADLELSRLDDRKTNIQTEEEVLRARLSQWLADTAWHSIENRFPELPQFSEVAEIYQLITQHPSIAIETARLEAGRQDVAIANEQYSAGWELGLEYRKRFGENADGSERVDMMAALVTFDVPLFAEKRQDKRVAASEEKMLAVKLQRDDQLRKLKQTYEINRVKLAKLEQRRNKYQTDLIKSAESNSKAALKAYQSGVGEFNNLMRAHITELDVRLSDLRVRVDYALAMAQLLYVTGDER